MMSDFLRKSNRVTREEYLYMLKNLPYHLNYHEDYERLHKLLTTFGFLQEKVDELGIEVLLEDYVQTPIDALGLVGQALRHASHIVSQDKELLASQLIGRLMDDTTPSVQKLLTQVHVPPGTCWLRPLKASLTPPGGLLVRTLNSGTSTAWNPLAITSDGSRAFATSGWTVDIWDVDAAEKIRTLAGHEDFVNAVAITADGGVVISGAGGSGGDTTVKVWDSNTGRLLNTYDGHSGPINSVAIITPREDQIGISAADDHTIAVWDVHSGNYIDSLYTYGKVKRVAVTASGRFILAVSHYPANIKTILWDVHNNSASTLDTHSEWAGDVAIAPDGSLGLSSTDDYEIKVWDIESGQAVRVLQGHTQPVTALTIAKDNRRAASADLNGVIKVWDIDTGRNTHTLSGHAARINGIALSSSGIRLLSASYDQTIKVWDLSNDHPARQAKSHRSWINSVAIVPDGHLAVSGSSDKTVKVWDVATGWCIHTLRGHMGRINDVAVAANGRIAVSASQDRTVKVWNIVTGREIRTLRGHSDEVNAVVLADDDKRLLSAARDHTIKVWNMETGQNMFTLSHPDSRPFYDLAVAADGRLALSSSPGSYRLWNLVTRDSQVLPSSGIEEIAMTADGLLAFSTANSLLSEYHQLRVHDTTTRQEIDRIDCHKDIIYGLDITNDGRYALTASSDKTVRLWQRSKEEEIKEIARFYADGNLRCCAVADGDFPAVIAGDSLGYLHFLRLEKAG